MRSVFSAVALLVVLLLPAFAHADTFHFTIYGAGDGETFTFSIDPATDYAGSGTGVDFYNVTATDTYSFGSNQFDGVQLYTTPGNQSVGIGEIGFFGVEFLNGSTILPDVYTVYRDNDSNDPYVMTITEGPSVASTPEPSSIALLGTGVVGVAGAVRRRFVRS